MSLRLQYLNDISSLAGIDRSCVFGAVFFSSTPVAETDLAIDLKPLGTAGAELWLSDRPVRRERAGTITYACDGDVLFGTMTRVEADFPTLAALGQDVYAELFALLDRAGYPQLFRVWNYLPDITGAADGMERYRRFNMGRHAAFVARQRRIHQPPAATGIGSLGGQPAFYFLAIKGAVAALENPRQVSAYHYPPDYGPCSPTFSRAGIGIIDGQRRLAISGTASIVGHASLHAGDAAAQTRETLANIRILLAAAAEQEVALTPADLILKVYLRAPADLAMIQHIIETEFGCGQVCYLQADICRAELLVEIEAFA